MTYFFLIKAILIEKNFLNQISTYGQIDPNSKLRMFLPQNPQNFIPVW